MRKYNRDTQYDAEYRASLARKVQPPKNLLAWFLEAFRAELPEKIHAADVWRDRRYIEDSPFSTEVAEYEGHKDVTGHYAFPLRAALARLAGRGRETDVYPFMARALHRTALLDGDYDEACRSLGITQPVRQVYIEEALRRLWTKYEIEPPARTLRSDAA